MVLSAAIVMALSQSSVVSAQKLTTYERQVNLMNRINDAENKKQLTVSQAKALRKELSKIAVKKQQVREDHTGKTGKEDMSLVEERLTKVSAKINNRIEKNAATNKK